MLFSYDIVLIVYFLCYAVVNVQEILRPHGGLKWTRTTAINGLGAVGLYPEAFASWWAKVDSNHRPHAYQACALTS